MIRLTFDKIIKIDRKICRLRGMILIGYCTNLIFIGTMRTTSTGSQHFDQNPDEITWNPKASMENHKSSSHKIDLTQVYRASQLFSQTDVIEETPLLKHDLLSSIYGAEILLKREDRQLGHTYKIRGSYYQYLISDQHRRKEGYIVVSDGNFAASCAIVSGMFNIKFTLFVPTTCHTHKLERMKHDGKDFVEVIQVGHDFEQCNQAATQYAQEHKLPILKSFETLSLFHGFATMAKQIVDSQKKKGIDYILVPAGGGGLASSIASVIKQISPNTKVIAVEPDICKPFSESILTGSLVSAQKSCRFCDGSSIKSPSSSAVDIGCTSVDGFVEVSLMKVAEKIIKLYSQGVICQPSGALSVTGLDKVKHLIKGKRVVCILSGANIDLVKLDEAREMAMVSKGIKNHFQFKLPNRKTIIYELITECFKPTDIISIHYSQSFGKEDTQTVLSVESIKQEDVEQYITKFNEHKYDYVNINEREDMLDIFF